MKRFWIMLLAAAMAIVIAIPAGAGKPCCGDADECAVLGLTPTPDHPTCVDPEPTTTTVPTATTTAPSSDDPCVFDTEGVLEGWPETNSYRCEWTVTDPSRTVSFELWSPDGSVTSVKLAHLIVNDDIVFPSNICFHDTRRGPQDLPFPGDDLWTFSPQDRGCGEGPYFLTISVQKIRSGVELVMK